MRECIERREPLDTANPLSQRQRIPVATQRFQRQFHFTDLPTFLSQAEHQHAEAMLVEIVIIVDEMCDQHFAAHDGPFGRNKHLHQFAFRKRQCNQVARWRLQAPTVGADPPALWITEPFFLL